MSEPMNLKMTNADVLAAIAFGAQRIVAAAGNHAAGAPFPHPDAIGQEIARMHELNEALKAMQRQPANEAAA